MPNAARLNRPAEAIVKGLVIVSKAAARIGRGRIGGDSFLFRHFERRIASRIEENGCAVVPGIIPIAVKNCRVAIPGIRIGKTTETVSIINGMEPAERVVFVFGYNIVGVGNLL